MLMTNYVLDVAHVRDSRASAAHAQLQPPDDSNLTKLEVDVRTLEESKTEKYFAVFRCCCLSTIAIDSQ